MGDTFEEQKLRRAIARFEEQAITASDLRRVEEEVIAEVVREQEAAGIDVVTDGLVTWYDPISHFARRLSGCNVNGLVRYFDTNTYYRQPVVEAEPRWVNPITLDDFKSASSVARNPVKCVVTGPFTLANMSLDKRHSLKSKLKDFASAISSEIEALARAGALWIQVDEPYLVSDSANFDDFVRAFDVLREKKGMAKLILATYFGEVSRFYDRLQDIGADYLHLDLVQGKGDMKVIEEHGASTPIMLGVVDARNTRLESPEHLARSLLSVARSIPSETSFVSTSNSLEYLPRSKAREKARIVTETARTLEAML